MRRKNDEERNNYETRINELEQQNIELQQKYMICKNN